MPKITLQGQLCVPQSQLEAVKTALEEHTRLTREEPGCIVFEVTQRDRSPLIFDVYEEFTHQEAFDWHQSRVRNSTWSEVTRHTERHYRLSTDE